MLRLLFTIVIPMTIYESEYWILKHTERNKLRALQINCLRRVLNICWQDRIPNSTVRVIIVRAWKNVIDVVKDQQRRCDSVTLIDDVKKRPAAILYSVIQKKEFIARTN